MYCQMFSAGRFQALIIKIDLLPKCCGNLIKSLPHKGLLNPNMLLASVYFMFVGENVIHNGNYSVAQLVIIY